MTLPRSALGRRTVGSAASVTMVLAGTALTGAVLSALDLAEPWDHAAGHATVAIAAATLLALALRSWPAPPAHIAHLARLVLVAGFTVSAVGQGLEAAGAFGSQDGSWRSGLARLHGVAAYVGTLGLVLTLFGGLVSLLTAAAERMGLLGSRWMAAVLAVPVLAVCLFLGGALVFGY